MADAPSPKVIGLFPTPLMKVDRLVDAELLSTLEARALALQRASNTATDLLSHTLLVDPRSDAVCQRLAELVAPQVVSFGTLLFAKPLRWGVKEMWFNVLERGGSQFMHTHANSFVSGIVYVNKPLSEATTLFRKSTGAGEFIFRNDVPADHYSSDTWRVPDVEAGDLVLYPSYLMHGVPPNEGDRRITVAFNAIPDQLDSLGYKIRFGM